MQKIFVTGIGTGVGKTVVSAILVEALGADYWKPVQAGDLDQSDTLKVQGLISNSTTSFHREAYTLSLPMSPHAAAAIDGVHIRLEQFVLPVTQNHLIIEGAGGLMVPLSNNLLVIDLIKHLGAEVVLVSRHYLGSINHTLLSAFALQQRGIPVKGIIFVGAENAATEAIIAMRTGYKVLGRIAEEHIIDQHIVARYAAQFSKILL